MFTIDQLMEAGGGENFIREKDGKGIAVFCCGGGFVARNVDRFQIAQIFADKDWDSPQTAYAIWDAIIKEPPGVHALSGTPIEVFEDVDNLLKAVGLDHTSIPRQITENIEENTPPPENIHDLKETISSITDSINAVPSVNGFKRISDALIIRLKKYVDILRLWDFDD